MVITGSARRLIGVLAFQGAIEPHLRMIERCGAAGTRVRCEDEIAAVDALIIPGGESTTMIKLIDRSGLWDTLERFCKKKPVWGTCAGAILLAKEVHSPSQKSFQAIDISAERNAYGSQRESFKEIIEVKPLGLKLPVYFIRAPRLRPLSKSVSILATCKDEPVLMCQGKVLASSFHVELGEDDALHRYFINQFCSTAEP